MKHKISELEGALLDASVAKALGYEWRIDDGTIVYAKRWGETRPEEAFCPSMYWDHGGPIIDRERIVVYHIGHDHWSEPWVAGENIRAESEGSTEESGFGVSIEMDYSRTGPTPLIAAMRAYCASRFGEEVELP